MVFQDNILEKNQPNIGVDDIAKINTEVYLDYKSARQNRYSKMVENDNFYHNDHFDEIERKEIIARGQAPLAINVVYPILKQMISLITGGDPIWDVDPVTDADKEYAYMFRHLLYGTWYHSRGSRHFSQIVKNCVITGVGYGAVNPSYRGIFGMDFTWIPYHHVYIDPSSSDFDVNDADNIIISRVLSSKQIGRFLSLSDNEVKEIITSPPIDEGVESEEEETRVPLYTVSRKGNFARVIQRLSLERRKVYIVTPKKRQLGGSNNIGSQKVYFEIDENLKKLQSQGIIEIKERERTVLGKYISVNGWGRRYYLPIDNYNVVPFFDEFNGNPYALGEMDFLYGLQRALNKNVMLMILNATLANSLKMLAPKDSINKREYEESYSLPGVLIEYEWSEGMPPPHAIMPQPLSSEFFAFPQRLINIMEYVTGIFGVIQGNPEGAPRTASGLISLQNYGGQKIKLLGRSINEALSTVGNVAIQLFQNYAPYNQLMTYKDSDNKLVAFPYNTLTANPQTGDIVIENDLSIGKYRATVSIKQHMGAERQQQAAVLSNLAAQTGASVLLKPILKLADIPDADKVADELDEVARMKATIGQLENELKRVNQVNNQLQNEIIQMSQKVSLKQFESKLNDLYNKIKSEVSVNVTNELNDFRNQMIQSQSMQNENMRNQNINENITE